jgi:hypothetical protein
MPLVPPMFGNPLLCDPTPLTHALARALLTHFSPSLTHPKERSKLWAGDTLPLSAYFSSNSSLQPNNHRHSI